jgi:hypothetical protein
MMTDDQLLADLRDLWQAADPAPADLAERVLFTLQLEALQPADVDFELLRLCEAVEPVGARGHESARTLTFEGDSLTVMVTVSGPGAAPRRLDGWIAPAGELRVELRTGRGSTETTADTGGRFAFTDVASGLVQLVLHPPGGPPMVTPALTL